MENNRHYSYSKSAAQVSMPPTLHYCCKQMYRLFLFFSVDFHSSLLAGSPDLV